MYFTYPSSGLDETFVGHQQFFEIFDFKFNTKYWYKTLKRFFSKEHCIQSSRLVKHRFWADLQLTAIISIQQWTRSLFHIYRARARFREIFFLQKTSVSLKVFTIKFFLNKSVLIHINSVCLVLQMKPHCIYYKNSMKKINWIPF